MAYFNFQDLQSVVQQQRADMESATDALTALCRSHPSQELTGLSSELTSIAKRTEAVAQCWVKTKSNLQDGLQLHFNGKKKKNGCFSYFVFCALYYHDIGYCCSFPTMNKTKHFKSTEPPIITHSTCTHLHDEI